MSRVLTHAGRLNLQATGAAVALHHQQAGRRRSEVTQRGGEARQLKAAPVGEVGAAAATSRAEPSPDAAAAAVPQHSRPVLTAHPLRGIGKEEPEDELW